MRPESDQITRRVAKIYETAHATAQQRVVTDSARRRKVIAVAERVFIEKGFVSTTMDDIARAAMMSKKTIYQLFESKKELFDALISQRLALMAVLPDDTDRAPEVVLRELLLRLAHFILSPEQMALTRLILAELVNAPEVGDVLRTHCRQGETAIEKWVTIQTRKGTFRITDICDASGLLFSMSFGDYLWHLMLQLDSGPSEEALSRRIDWAVSVFMRDFGPKPARSPVRRKGIVAT